LNKVNYFALEHTPLLVFDIFIIKKMFECNICKATHVNKGSLMQHQKKCEKLQNLKEHIIKMYVEENYSIRDLRKKYKIQSEDIKLVLKNLVRSKSEANKIARKKYPNKFVHSNETKLKLREIRLNFMKNNPDKTAWRLSNLSYPEKLFVEYIEKKSLNNKYTIIREFSIYPYFVDFAFLNEKLAVEIDGSQHILPERKKRDDLKDKLLNEYGWDVLRISENETKKDIENVFNYLISVLENKEKKSNHKIGLVVKPKQPQKKSRNEFGYTELQIKHNINQRKHVRPSLDILLKQVEELGFKKTGEFYGVSDNSIRKWIKAYKKGLI
jgi:very-short-patch-repair endonuclease